jgi:hypothetical protein
VKPIKMFGLAVLAALMAMAFVGASSAMAGPTSICKKDENPCKESNQITHLHETTLTGAKAKLLNGSGEVQTECDVLFLGDALAGLSSEYLIHGHFTYSNCSNGCSAKEVTGTDALISVLRTGHETGEVTGEGEVTVTCIFFSCTYNGEELNGEAKGPLLSSETNGSVSLSNQKLFLVKGSFCPSEGKLDITTTPLSAQYLTE